MPKTDYEKSILENIKERAKYKAKVDSKINLSKGELNGDLFTKGATLSKTNQVIALSEGAVVDWASHSGVRFYLAKGSIQEAVDRFIVDDIEALVNVGHIKYQANPYLGKVGYFTKEDLAVELKEDGRSDLIINIHLDEEHGVIKQLKKDQDTLSVSIELGLTSENDAYYDEDLDLYVITGFNITGLGIVGDPANVFSYGQIKLSKGEKSMSTTEQKDEQALNTLSNDDVKGEDTDETSNSEIKESSDDTSEQVTETDTKEQEEQEEQEEVTNTDDTNAEPSVSTPVSLDALAQLQNLTAKYDDINKVNTDLTLQNIQLTNELSELKSYKTKYEQLEQHLASLATDTSVPSRQVDNLQGKASKSDDILAKMTRI